jgi:stage V sporulation protein SpoVS
MKFNGIDQAIILDNGGNGFLNGGDFTFGCRAAGSGVTEMGVYAFSGGQGQASLHLPQSVGGTTLGFVRNDAAQFISVFGIGAINDDVEHVLLARYTDAAQRLDIWIDGVANNTGVGVYSPPATTTAHSWAAFVDPVPFLFFLGDISWSAGWGRALTDEQMEYTFAVPNPFGRAA